MKAYKWSASRPGVNMNSPGEYVDIVVLATDEDEARELAKDFLAEHGYGWRWDATKYEVFDKPSIVYQGIK